MQASELVSVGRVLGVGSLGALTPQALRRSGPGMESNLIDLTNGSATVMPPPTTEIGDRLQTIWAELLISSKVTYRFSK